MTTEKRAFFGPSTEPQSSQINSVPKLTDQQVRQKLIHQGVLYLNEAELLSILLGRGEGAESALELAERVLLHFEGNLIQMGRCELRQLRIKEKMGIQRAATLTAALELGRRYRMQEQATQKQIQTTRDVVDLFQPQMAALDHEEFWVLYLNSANHILERVRAGQGGVSSTVVDHKLVIKKGLELLAMGMIVVHNHPSSDPHPSTHDRELTERLYRAGALFDIHLADHIIITTGNCYSFRNEGFFDPFEKENMVEVLSPPKTSWP